MYNFGSPRVGNAAFAKQYNSLVRSVRLHIGSIVLAKLYVSGSTEPK
jgi:hypothetical protein